MNGSTFHMITDLYNSSGSENEKKNIMKAIAVTLGQKKTIFMKT